jgi:hypothetical protein
MVNRSKSYITSMVVLGNSTLKSLTPNVNAPWDLLLTELVTKVKPNINIVEVHLQPSNNGHPVDGGCRFTVSKKEPQLMEHRPWKYGFGRGPGGSPGGEGCTRLTSSESLTFWIFFNSTNLNKSRPMESLHWLKMTQPQGKLAWSTHLGKGTKLPAQNKNSHLGHDTSDLILYRVSSQWISTK